MSIEGEAHEGDATKNRLQEFSSLSRSIDLAASMIVVCGRHEQICRGVKRYQLKFLVYREGARRESLNQIGEGRRELINNSRFADERRRDSFIVDVKS